MENELSKKHTTLFESIKAIDETTMNIGSKKTL
jgi:hypothetical protein